MLRFLGVPEDIFYWLDLHINYTLFGGILIGLYVSIYCTIKYQLAQSLRTQGYNRETRRQPVHNEIEAKMKAERKMTKTVSLLVLAAIICMLPLYIILHVKLLCKSCVAKTAVDTISKLSEPILFLNSGLNPFLYAWTIPKYRQALKKMLRTWCLCPRKRNNYGKTRAGPFRSAFAIQNQGMVDGITSNPIQLTAINVRGNNSFITC